MAKDIKGHEARLKLLTSFESVVATFSTPLEIDEKCIEKDLAGLLTSEASLTLFAEASRDVLAAKADPWRGNAVHSFLSGLASADTYSSVRWSSWADAPRVALRRVQEVAGHKIGQNSWYTAVVDWILVGLALAPSVSSVMLIPSAASVPTWIACEWRTKLLFSDKQGEPPTLLQYWTPESLDAAEQSEWEPLVRKAMPRGVISQLPDVSAGTPLGFAALAAALFMAFAKKGDVADDIPGDTSLPD